MHSRIFELSGEPIPIEKRMTSDDIPEWFCDSIADYVDDMAPERRTDDAEWFCTAFRGDCAYDADTGAIRFTAEAKKHFFEQKYWEFREALAKLQAVSFEEFAGFAGRSETETNIYMLRESYEREFNFCVTEGEDSELITLDAWVRTVDLTKTFFLGGIVDYHF